MTKLNPDLITDDDVFVFRGVLHIVVVQCPLHLQPLLLMEAPRGRRRDQLWNTSL